MKSTLIFGVRRIVKQRAGQVRKLFAGTVATLALKIRLRGRLIGVWTTDDAACIWFDRRGRVLVLSLLGGRGWQDYEWNRSTKQKRD